MKIGFLIRVDKAGKAELIGSGNVQPLKARFATEKLDKGEVLHLTGPSTRYRKRGDAADWTALSAVIEKENAQFRARHQARREAAEAAKTKPNPTKKKP